MDACRRYGLLRDLYTRQLLPILGDLNTSFSSCRVCSGTTLDSESHLPNHTGRRYAQIGKSVPEAIINRYFGIFFLFFQSSQIIGNLVSSLVLKSDDSTDEENNQTEFTCGAQDCYTETGDENATTYCDPPDKNLTNILLSVYLACGIAAVITVALFVQRLERNDKKTPETTCGLFLATTKLMREANIVLLIPLTVYSGLEQAFITGDFTKSFVTCTVGVGWVGYIMICYGATMHCSHLSGVVSPGKPVERSSLHQGPQSILFS
ncbi:hypothetical protein BSL78_15807 [Apostichopus japonicus]|uniref:Uncharacterized protein n=1 Tax=Stichopus japonicus TaxID=307972 RepID=A0A2G8KH51_STIJA|nr:hypothetical protein BSL78_15807 [Apostichopus japonicus]